MLLSDVFKKLGALQRPSVYDSIAMNPDGTATMVIEERDLEFIPGIGLVIDTPRSAWRGNPTHGTTNQWIRVLDTCKRSEVRLGIKHLNGTFSARPDMLGTIEAWDGENFRVVFKKS